MNRFTKNKKIIILLVCVSLVGLIFIYNFIIKDKKINNVTSSEQVKDKTLDEKNKTEDTKENSKSSNEDVKKEHKNGESINNDNNGDSQKNTIKDSDNNKNIISKEETYTSKAIDENHGSKQLQPIKKDDTIKSQSGDKHNIEKTDKKDKEINVLNQKNGNYSIDIKKINTSDIKIVINSKNLNDSNEGRIMIYNDKNSLVYIDQGELESGKLNFNTQLDSGSYTGYYKVEGDKKPISFVIK